MSKLEEMAVAYGNNQVGFFSDLTNAYTQGWKDCLKHSEEVKELVAALLKCKERLDFIENNSIKNACCINCAGIYESQITIGAIKKALSKFREKVGE